VTVRWYCLPLPAVSLYSSNPGNADKDSKKEQQQCSITAILYSTNPYQMHFLQPFFESFHAFFSFDMQHFHLFEQYVAV
jgi:hypothetical protein